MIVLLMWYCILFGPSVLGIVIAVMASLRCTRNGSKIALTILALSLHGVSSGLLFVGVRIGEAWSGYSSSHNMPFGYGFFGALIIITINLTLRSARTKQVLMPRINYSKVATIILSVVVALFFLLMLVNN